MNAFEFFSVEAVDGVCTVTMNRPPLNVLHIPMMVEFNNLLEETVLGGDTVAVVLRASGKAFSAGVDVADHSPDRVGEMIRLFHGIFRKLASTDALSIAAVRGAALGGGCELACFCDLVLASDRSKFGQPEIQLGVFPPVAACLLPLQIGLKKAVELCALGSTIDAAEAHRIGLVNQVIPEAEFEAEVERYLEGLRRLSRPVVRLAKRATSLGTRELVLERLQETERMYLGELMELEDSREGIDAFLQKRSPRWVHA